MGNRSARGGRILRPADENERRHERLNSPEVSGGVERFEVRARARDDREATVDQVPGASERDGAEGNHTPYRRLAECGEVAQASKGIASTSGGATGMGTFGVSTAPDQALWVCEAFAETSHPCDRRSQTMHFKNIEPRSHDTQ